MKYVAAIMFLVPSVAFAAPLKIPNLSLCAQSSGAIVVKQRCAKSETKLVTVHGPLSVRVDRRCRFGFFLAT